MHKLFNVKYYHIDVTNYNDIGIIYQGDDIVITMYDDNMEGVYYLKIMMGELKFLTLLLLNYRAKEFVNHFGLRLYSILHILANEHILDMMADLKTDFLRQRTHSML